MRNIFLISLLVISMANAQTKSINKQYYQVEYSEDLQSPVYVEYEVLCPRKGPVSRKGLGFKPEPGYKTADNDDYYKNVWDKGHMAPAAAFDCNMEMLKSTFSYVNSALQHQSLNRGQWKDLEAYERRLATYGKVFVEIEILFDNPPNRVPAGAAIPKGFIKRINSESHGTLNYYFDNKHMTDRDVRNYLIN